MHWLNIEIIRTQGPEYTSAEPAQQLAWFHLLLYCAQQENGGIIREASTFTDRQWMRLIDVEGATLRGECLLWTWAQDGSLIVWEYPAKQEQVVQAKREGGRRGGDAKAQNRSTPSGTPSRTPTSTPSRTPSTKEEEKEEEKEELKQEEEEKPQRVPQGDPPPPAAKPEEAKPEKEKRPKPGPEPEACATTLPGKPSAELMEAWGEWQQYRQRRAIAPGRQRVAWTAQAARLSAKQVSQYAASHGDRMVCDRIASAINGEWQGLNLDKLEAQAYKPGGKMTREEEARIFKPNPKSINGW